jgi:hypothetical protein
MSRRHIPLLAALALLAFALLATSADADFGFQSGPEGFSVSSQNADGSLATQSGSHPYAFTTSLRFNQIPSPRNGEPIPDGSPRDVHVAIPPGLVGNPTVVDRCTAAQFQTQPPNVAETGRTTECTDATAIGTALIQLEPGATHLLPVFNLVAPPGVPAEFGFSFAGFPVLLTPHLRPDGSYGLTIDSLNTSQGLPVYATKVTIWGVPYDHRHDEERGSCITSPGTCSISLAPRAYLTLPASCTGVQTTTVTADSWQNPGAYLANGEPDLTDPAWASATSDPLGLDGCGKVPFTPTVAAQPTTNQTTASTGLNFDIDFADEGLTNPEGVAQSEIKKAVVTLPQGFTVNPSAGAGLSACSLPDYEAIGLHSATECPESSKVGDVEIESPLVEEKVDGAIYVAKQTENPFGSLLALYIVARNPHLGILVKSAAEVHADPVTGQLTTTVDEIPQLPFSHFRLSFHQGQTSPLVSPPACGEYTVKADLYPWSNPEFPLPDTASFRITAGTSSGPCPSGGVPPFHPELHAGSYSNQAGAYAPFYLRLSRQDSEQEFTHFSIKLPPGVSGKLAGIPYCSDAAIAQAKAREHEGGGAEELASPSCPLASEVGRTLVEAGVGSVLAQAPGHVYLAGPYHGSNLSLVSITAAKVGPFDLGTVVVRFALRIDPETAEVFVDAQGSDPIPHIVDGIPVHLRNIHTYVDRPSFVLNPTSCAQTSTASTVLGSGLDFASEADDQPVTVSSFFQVANCSSLGFKPKLALSLKGGARRGATPAFKAVLTYPKGSYANIAKSVVTLPHSEFLENAHIGTVCTRVQFKEGTIPGERCPAASIYGFARAITPILSEPLEGPVFLRSSEHKLPDLVAALHNAQVDIALDGRIDSVKGGQIRNSFEAVPDAPVSKFVLEMQGGKKGLLVNSTDLCKSTHRAISEFTGQNGKVYDTRPALRAKCPKGRKKKRGPRQQR